MDTYEPDRAVQALQDELTAAGEVLRGDRLLIDEHARQVETELELSRANAALDAPAHPAGTPDGIGDPSEGPGADA